MKLGSEARALELIVELDGDSQRDYRKLGPDQAATCAKDLFDAWELVTNRDPAIVTAIPNSNEDDKSRKLRRLGLLLGGNLVSALAAADEALLPGPKTVGSWFPYLQSVRTNLRQTGTDPDALVERSMLSSYLDARWNIMFMRTVGSAAMGGTPVGWDKFVFWSIEEINRIAASFGWPEHMTLAVEMTLQLTVTAREAVDSRDKADFDRRESALGLLAITQELPLLASRHATMQDRYGSKQVESRFEQQLSILMQSLGYFTVPTVPGERRIDLVCISAAPDQSGGGHTILLEAKSTSNDYGLPADDSRAIEEYAHSSKANLSTMPPVKLILIVGPKPKTTVADKVRRLEARTGLPVRYCEAYLLARLRRAVPGPVAATKLLDSLIKSPELVTWEVLHSVVEADKRRRDAHIDFVSTMFRP